MDERAVDVSFALARDYIDTRPGEVAAELERVPLTGAVSLVKSLDPSRVARLLDRLNPERAAELIEALGGPGAAPVVQEGDPARLAIILSRVPGGIRDEVLGALPPGLRREIEELMAYPPDSAGAMMDPSVTSFRPSATVAQALSRLRALRSKRVQYVFVTDDEGCLVGAVPLQELAIADPGQYLQDLVDRAAPAPSVLAMSSQAEVVEILETSGVTALAVVDVERRLVGVIRSDALIRAAEAAATAGMLTMVGVSKEERALSPMWFAVRRRLPWLNINLLTAFLAAAVVGLFEDTIARFTALAVLLPVVAGQSGNTGAQALAVTMRGLALREIRLRHWARIGLKEVGVGAVNGVAVALVTGLGVLVWSRSLALAAVISIAMVLSMTIASLSGASVPMILTVLKQDPAQASSIILTTVTDVMGFLSFLGLATLASGFL